MVDGPKRLRMQMGIDVISWGMMDYFLIDRWHQDCLSTVDEVEESRVN